jgi:uncharacterized integral membrane protein
VRFVHIALTVVFTALLLFTVRNFETATVSHFSLRITLSVALLLIGVHVLGKTTGGALLRSGVSGARARRSSRTRHGRGQGRAPAAAA